jgi:hypothetical protein
MVTVPPHETVRLSPDDGMRLGQVRITSNPQAVCALQGDKDTLRNCLKRGEIGAHAGTVMG